VFTDDYDYPLPEELIAQHPLEVRDLSRLVVYYHGKITEDLFRNLSHHLPEKCLLVFNDTRVIRARMLFHRPTGSITEVFCLEPAGVPGNLQESLDQASPVTWKCLIGKGKRWKEQLLTQKVRIAGEVIEVTARRSSDAGDGCHLVTFEWNPAEIPFVKIMEAAGAMPLPPYINRPPVEDDTFRYQTVFASQQGSVAAPTAGLHFTACMLKTLDESPVIMEKITLHVGLGTFRPVTVQEISGHVMHKELFAVKREVVERLCQGEAHRVIAVGTTSARTLESLYWLGARLKQYGTSPEKELGQWEPYRNPCVLPPAEALTALQHWLTTHGKVTLEGSTSLLIVPGYHFRVIKGMVTNFHQPRSTLLMLVSAFAGSGWKEVYQYAIDRRYRFLSYGDACLFLAG
jgi:S-adenosylmethionine:tRNA ribosyltransferase-isomerase